LCLSVFIFYLKAKSFSHSTVTVGQAVTEINVSPLFRCELDNGRCDALLPVEEKKEMLGLYGQVRFFYKQAKTFHPDRNSAVLFYQV
jgi:hypothetical protein